MTGPRAFVRATRQAAADLAPELMERLSSLGEAAKAKIDAGETPRVFQPLFDRISQTLQRGTTPEATTLIARAERILGERGPASAAAIVENARRAMNPSRDLRTTTFDPAQTARYQERAEAPAQRALKKAERKKLNREEAEALRAAIAAAGDDAEAVAALKAEANAKREARNPKSRSYTAQAGGTVPGTGTGRDAVLNQTAREMRQDVNRRRQGKDLKPGEVKLTDAEADAEYARINEMKTQQKGKRIAEERSGDTNTRTLVSDQRLAQEGAYYDVNNPQARDREVPVRGSGGQLTRRVPGGLDENVVAASAIVRQHIDRMLASKEIAAAPPDAAMPNIIRTAMREMGIPDAGKQDMELLRAYRFQARRKGAFDPRKTGEPGPDADLEGTGDIEMAGVKSLENMTERLRSGSQPRQATEEGFVDDIVAQLDRDPDAADVPVRGIDIARRTNQAAQATVDNPENLEGMTFRELESARRGRNRAGRLEGQVRRMDAAGEGAERRNMKRREIDDVIGDEPVVRKPRQAILQDETGPRVFVNKPGRGKPRQDEFGNEIPGRPYMGLREARSTGGIVRRPDAPPAQNPNQQTGTMSREFMEERPGFEGERESLGPVRVPRPDGQGFPSRYSGIEPGGTQGSPSRVSNDPMATEAANAASDVQAQLAEVQGLAEQIQRANELQDEPMYREAVTEMAEAYDRLQLRIERARNLLTQELGQEAATGRARMGMVEEGANEDIDRLVRVLMERVGQMPPQQRDAYFAGSPLDRQMMLNRDRSQTFRAVQEQASRDTPDTEFGGNAIPFPSAMGRQYPQENPRASLIKMILEAMAGGQ